MVIDRLHLCKCMKLRYSLEKNLTESIKTLNGKSCSPEVITTIIGSFICAGLSWKRFLCSQAGEKEGVGGRFMGQLVHLDSSQILAFQLSGGGGALETKVLNPWKH